MAAQRQENGERIGHAHEGRSSGSDLSYSRNRLLLTTLINTQTALHN